MNSEKSLEQRRGGGRDAADLVRGLAVEFEVQLGLRSAVVPSLPRMARIPRMDTADASERIRAIREIRG